MDSSLVLIRLVLAAVFGISGLAKLVDRGGSARAAADFGLTPRLARVTGTLLPVAELGAAVALVPASTALGGAAGALGLLAAFIVGISVNLARGRRPDCHCFGQLHSAPVGPRTLARNGVLAGAAAFVAAAGPGPALGSWSWPLTAAETLGVAAGVVLGALVLVEGWFLLALLRQNGRLLLRLDELEARVESAEVDGAQLRSPRRGAPDFSLPGVHGETLTLAALLAPARPVVLVFTDPKCGPCNALMPEVAAWQRSPSVTVAVVGQGDAALNRAKAAEHGLAPVLVQVRREVAEAYGASATPCAVIVEADGSLAGAPVCGPDAIRSAVQPLAGAPRSELVDPSVSPRRGLAVGQPAPPLELVDLDGRVTELPLRGEPSLVLFWNPGCGFCQKMLDDLRTWESYPPEGAPRLVVISQGSVEANRAMALRAPVFLDPGSSAMRAYQVNGTPMAVLVDDQGRVASQLAVGSHEVLALAGGGPRDWLDDATEGDTL